MQQSLIIFLIASLIVFLYIFVKYLLNKKHIFRLQKEAPDLLPNAIEDSKEWVFAFFDDLKSALNRNIKTALHWVLHFFVILLGFISDITDILYAKARDFFLKTATKEREAVSTFWHHLKEYKREKEEGK